MKEYVSRMVKNMTRKSKKSVWIGIVLIALSGVFVVKSADMNGNDMIQVEELDGNNGQEGQDMLSNPEVELQEQEDGMGENDEKVYKDKFVELEVIYLGYGMSSVSWPMQKKMYEDGEEGAYTGHHIFFSQNGFEKQIRDWDIYDVSFDLTVNPDNYYLMIYGRELSWMQYNPGKMSQFGGVEYRIGVDWESDVKEGTFFFYEIDGGQIERGYLPEEITLEF